MAKSQTVFVVAVVQAGDFKDHRSPTSRYRSLWRKARVHAPPAHTNTTVKSERDGSCDARLRCSTRFASVLVRSFRSVRRARCFDLIDRVRNSRAPTSARISWPRRCVRLASPCQAQEALFDDSVCDDFLICTVFRFFFL